MIGHLPRIFDLAGALLTPCASVSFAASSDVFTAEVLVIRFEAVYGVAHCYVIVASFAEPRDSRDPRDETTTRAVDRLGARPCNDQGSDRFVDLFVRSAPWSIRAERHDGDGYSEMVQ
jgi:hypothetical protein